LVPALAAPPMKAVEARQELAYIANISADFTRYIAMRWAVGGIPLSNSKSREMGAWVRLREDDPVEDVTATHLLALVDAWPPAVLPHLSAPAAGSSLICTIEFMQPLPALSRNRHGICLKPLGRPA
jgi:acyl-CoA thioesterase